MKREVILDIITYLFFLLFLYTGIMKLIEHFPFYSALMKSRLLYRFTPILEWMIPITELLVAVCLLIPKTRRIALFSTSFLMGIFTIYVGYTAFFMTGRERPCTCGGIIEEMSWRWHFYFNSCFTILAIVGLWLDRNRSRDLILKSEPSNFHLS